LDFLSEYLRNKMKNLIISMSLLVLLGLLPAFVNADSATNECNTGSECINFGYKYHIGEGVKQDDFKAIEFLQKACDLNHARGCFSLGLMYDKGEGVKQDDFRSVEFYQKACGLNVGEGCSNLGFLEKLYCFEIILFNTFAFVIRKPKIRTTFANIQTTRFLVQKACGLNDGGGCSNLRVYYEYGKGIRKSGIKALEYYGKACDLKSVIGCKNYARLKK
jgi:TPR repeat protein